MGDCNGDTAIHSAAERGRLEVRVSFVEKKRKNIRMKLSSLEAFSHILNHSLRIVSFWCLKKRWNLFSFGALFAGKLVQVLRIFIDRLPSLDFLNNRGETPLHYAACPPQMPSNGVQFSSSR